MEIEAYLTKQVEYKSRIYFEAPYNLKEEDMIPYSQVEWSFEYGDYVHFDVDGQAWDDVMANYKISRATADKTIVYADEKCAVLFRRDDAGGDHWAEIHVPLQDEWELEDENTEVQL